MPHGLHMIEAYVGIFFFFSSFLLLDGATTEAGLSDERLGWLKEINVPKDLKMDGVEYLGPQIIDG